MWGLIMYARFEGFHGSEDLSRGLLGCDSCM
jgi:hypothetical protein